jgi:uridine kinase
MNNQTSSKLIALAGGSGSGKSWLANRLCEELGDEAMILSLDDFYCDLAHQTFSEREKCNFDHPGAIDWELFENVLCELRNNATAWAPRYDFVSHTRLAGREPRSSRPFVFVEGLWILWPPHLRALFDVRFFMDCPESLRWQRRLARDRSERGRTMDSIRNQFWNVVAPMHERFVEVQKAWADFVIEQPIGQPEFEHMIATIDALREEPGRVSPPVYGWVNPAPKSTALQPL